MGGGSYQLGRRYLLRTLATGIISHICGGKYSLSWRRELLLALAEGAVTYIYSRYIRLMGMLLLTTFQSKQLREGVLGHTEQHLES